MGSSNLCRLLHPLRDQGIKEDNEASTALPSARIHRPAELSQGTQGSSQIPEQASVKQLSSCGKGGKQKSEPRVPAGSNITLLWGEHGFMPPLKNEVLI